MVDFHKIHYFNLKAHLLIEFLISLSVNRPRGLADCYVAVQHKEEE